MNAAGQRVSETLYDNSNVKQSEVKYSFDSSGKSYNEYCQKIYTNGKLSEIRTVSGFLNPPKTESIYSFESFITVKSTKSIIEYFDFSGKLEEKKVIDYVHENNMGYPHQVWTYNANGILIEYVETKQWIVNNTLYTKSTYTTYNSDGTVASTWTEGRSPMDQDSTTSSG